MIPKIIHLCWFGMNPFPPLVEKCVASWKQKLPDYEIMIWNEQTFDPNSTEWTKRAYNKKQWAFVSDYVRLYALFKYGGVYLDTDLEVLKDFSDLLLEKQFVSGYIEGGLITCGFIASEKNGLFIEKLLSFYNNYSLFDEEGDYLTIMNPLIFTKMAQIMFGFDITKKEFSNEYICIYPMDYFMPYHKNTIRKDTFKKGTFIVTKNTYTIHHDMGSWGTRKAFVRLFFSLLRIILPSRLYYSMKVKNNKKTLSKMELSINEKEQY